MATLRCSLIPCAHTCESVHSSNRAKLYEYHEKIPTDETLCQLKMSDGFLTNAIFFKLGFLDKTKVAMGRQFHELLPLLWMKSGCHAACPFIDKSSEIPKMLILPNNRFAVLNDETCFDEFEKKVSVCSSIEQVYIVTNSEMSYKEMAISFEGKTTYQLYRDYLDNFRLNVRK